MAFIKGYKQTEEHKRKIANANTGKIRTPESKMKNSISHLGKKPWNKGKSEVFSKETLTKMREAKLGKAPPPHKVGCQCFRCSPKHGALNHNYINGSSDARNLLRRELRQWSQDILMRDEFTCVMCHCIGGRLNAHHIKRFADYPELRLSINNGVTLCEHCHKSVMKKEQEYEKLFQDLLIHD